MHILTVYFGALVFFALGAFCLRNTSPYTRSGGRKYERRARRRLFGKLLLIAGAIILVLAIMAQIAASGASALGGKQP